MDELRSVDVMSSLAKGLMVMEAFGPGRERLSITDASRLTGLDRAAARRCLLTLEKCGYVAHDGKYFTLTVRVLRLGYSYLSATSLPQRLQPYLEALSERIGESCSAAVLEDTHLVYIARAAQRRVMSVGLGVGSRLPVYCTSMGRVLLAALANAEVEVILARSDTRALTPHTLTDHAALLAEIERVRDQGYAIVDQELEIGLRSLAVPVRDQRGTVLAALNTGIQAGRTNRERMIGEILPIFREIQGKLTEVL